MKRLKLSVTVALAPALPLIFSMCGRGSSLDELQSKADAIVVGSVTSRVQAEDLVSFDIQVDRVLKGSTAISLVHVSHRWRGRNASLAPQTVGTRLYGVWFLKQVNPSDWEILPTKGPEGMVSSLFAPALQASAAAANLAADERAVETDISDRLILEVVAAVESQGTSPEYLLDALGTKDTPLAASILGRFLNSTKPEFRSVGLAGLLQRSKPDSLAQLSRIWPDLAAVSQRAYVVSALRNSFRDSTPTTIQQLALLAGTSASPELRNAAIEAVSAIHSRESLPFLASLLLSSSPDEQMRGVIGLSAFANGCPPQKPENVRTMEYLRFGSSPFRTKETEAAFAFRRGPGEQESMLVSFWRDWWNINNSSLTGN